MLFIHVHLRSEELKVRCSYDYDTKYIIVKKGHLWVQLGASYLYNIVNNKSSVVQKFCGLVDFKFPHFCFCHIVTSRVA